jgi:hypothetical protein
MPLAITIALIEVSLHITTLNKGIKATLLAIKTITLKIDLISSLDKNCSNI